MIDNKKPTHPSAKGGKKSVIGTKQRCVNCPKCKIVSGPSYIPTGKITPVEMASTFRKTADFHMTALFEEVVPDTLPRCCEVRQYVRWDTTYHESRGGRIHEGFPAEAKANTWYEDRNPEDNLRYGHRVGYSGGAPENQYVDSSGAPDQKNGVKFLGHDTVNAPPFSTVTGKWEFQLRVIDTCNGNRVVAKSSILEIIW